jgi:D-Tyr-tRNAtyr deacylase
LSVSRSDPAGQIFDAHVLVRLANDGPVTIIIDSKARE